MHFNLITTRPVLSRSVKYENKSAHLPKGDKSEITGNTYT